MKRVLLAQNIHSQDPTITGVFYLLRIVQVQCSVSQFPTFICFFNQEFIAKVPPLGTLHSNLTVLQFFQLSTTDYNLSEAQAVTQDHPSRSHTCNKVCSVFMCTCWNQVIETLPCIWLHIEHPNLSLHTLVKSYQPKSKCTFIQKSLNYCKLLYKQRITRKLL